MATVIPLKQIKIVGRKAIHRSSCFNDWLPINSCGNLQQTAE